MAVNGDDRLIDILTFAFMRLYRHLPELNEEKA